jgi:hypothetical protein
VQASGPQIEAALPPAALPPLVGDIPSRIPHADASHSSRLHQLHAIVRDCLPLSSNFFLPPHFVAMRIAPAKKFVLESTCAAQIFRGKIASMRQADYYRAQNSRRSMNYSREC